MSAERERYYANTVKLFCCEISWLYECDDYPGRCDFYTSIEDYTRHHGCGYPIIEVEVTYKAWHPGTKKPEHDER